jgi:hypothetical protein
VAIRWQKPVAQEKPPAFREGETLEGDAVRAKHPAFGWSWFACDPEGPNYERPVRWVEEEPDDPEHKGGRWVFTKDCD